MVTTEGVTGCVKHTSTYYTPTPGEARLKLDEAREQMDGIVRAECSRLTQEGKNRSRTGRIAVEIARDGLVGRSQVEATTGDPQLDKIFGGITAMLQFDPQPAGSSDPTTAHLLVGYVCSDVLTRATIEPL